jgi:hypothetical protein
MNFSFLLSFSSGQVISISIAQFLHYPFKHLRSWNALEFFVGHKIDIHMSIKPWNVEQPTLHIDGVELATHTQLQISP